MPARNPATVFSRRPGSPRWAMMSGRFIGSSVGQTFLSVRLARSYCGRCARRGGARRARLEELEQARQPGAPGGFAGGHQLIAAREVVPAELAHFRLDPPVGALA